MSQISHVRSVSLEDMHARLEGEASRLAINIIWALAALCLVVSIWINVNSDEGGGIYLRATLILYLTLSVTVEGNVIRSLRAAGSAVIVILAVNGLSIDKLNTPLFLATSLCLLHMVACVLTFGAGKLISTSGIRGLGFVLLGVGMSGVSVLISLYSYLPSWTVEQSISFGTMGFPLIVLANGIPKQSSNQVIACFTVLGPVAAGMYSLSALSDAAPWVLAVSGVMSATAAALLCLTSHKTWHDTARGMISFVFSSKVSALVIILLWTFGNIATINGYITETKEVTCFNGVREELIKAEHVVKTLVNTSLSAPFFLRNKNSIINSTIQYSECLSSTGCALSASDVFSSKEVEELLPLLLLGLAKGAVMSVFLSNSGTDKDEANAWSAGAFLGISAIIWLACEGRGRCLESPTDLCDPERSPGFIAGLAICGVASCLCILRSFYSSVVVLYLSSKQERMLANTTGDSYGAGQKCSDKYRKYIVEKVKTKESVMAIATTSLLVCLIASSSCSVYIKGGEMSCAVPGVGFSTLCDIRGGILQDAITSTCVSGQNVSSVMNCTKTEAENECQFLALSLSASSNYTPIPTTGQFQTRAKELEEYWQHTAWMIAGATAFLAVLAVESLPKNPSVGIALSTGLLMAAGLVHFSCLMNHLNARLSPTGSRFDFLVHINVYIVSIISVIIGVAWGAATYKMSDAANIVDPNQHEIMRRMSMVDDGKEPSMEVVFEVTEDPVEETDYESFEVLRKEGFLEAYVGAGLITCTGERGSLNNRDYHWSAVGKGDLQVGLYAMPITTKTRMRCARSATEGEGKYRYRKEGEKVKILF